MFAEKSPKILGAPFSRQIHQAFAKRVICATIVIVIVDGCLRHHHFLRDGTLLARLSLQCLLRALDGQVPRVVGVKAELFFVMHIAAHTVVVARSVVALKVGVEAGLP